jgi:hypothetical protein
MVPRQQQGNFDMLHNSFPAIAAVLMTLSTFGGTLVILDNGPAAVSAQLA